MSGRDYVPAYSALIGRQGLSFIRYFVRWSWEVHHFSYKMWSILPKLCSKWTNSRRSTPYHLPLPSQRCSFAIADEARWSPNTEQPSNSLSAPPDTGVPLPSIFPFPYFLHIQSRRSDVVLNLIRPIGVRFSEFLMQTCRFSEFEKFRKFTPPVPSCSLCDL